MSKRLWFLACAMLLAVTYSGASRAQVPPGDSAVAVAADESATLWFVELNSAPVADGGSLATVRNEKAAFRRAAAAAGLSFQERYAFDTLWNGLSVRIAPSDVTKLARIAGVKAIYPVATVEAPPPISDESGMDLAFALETTGASLAQTDLGLTGAGVKVGIMDTGIDYDHPDLGGCFGPGCRVATGWDFVGDAFGTTTSVPSPDADPDDCNGHGTHVAGIAGASGKVTGVAPGITFGAYRVFGCDGSTFSDIMIAAMERALADGMQVLNMSIGSSYQWPQFPTAQAASRLVNKKVIVVASIGNSGGNGVYSASAPGVGEKVIGVASFNNTHVTQPAFSVSPDDRLIGYNRGSGAPAAPLTGTYTLAKTGTTTTANDACNASPTQPAPGSLTGQVALIRRGTCGFYEKSRNAQNAGAAGVVLYNSVPGALTPNVVGTPPVTIPVVMISDVDGALLDGRIAAGPTMLTWTDQSVSAPFGTFAGLIAASSSFGLAPDLSLKPDIGAPGGAIFSTYPLELGGYASIGGTSMASPHVAGAVALMLEANPKVSHQEVRAILQNSADPRPFWGNPGLGIPDNVHRQGAGMLDIPGSILATTSVEPSKLSLGESEAGPATRTLTIRNGGASDVTFTLSHVAAVSTGGSTFAPGYLAGFATVAFSAPAVVVPAGSSATVDVTITANPGLADRTQYGGYVVLTGGGQTYRVPYAGLTGDYQSIQALTPATGFSFPWLAQRVGTSYENRPDGATYTMQGTDVAYILLHLDHAVRRLRMEVFDVSTGKNWHRAADFEYVGRNAWNAPTNPSDPNRSFFFTIGWDGETLAGNRTFTVPDGSYVMKVSVLKALGDAANPAHWETWTSPVITIARPPSGT